MKMVAIVMKQEVQLSLVLGIMLPLILMVVFHGCISMKQKLILEAMQVALPILVHLFLQLVYIYRLR